MREVVAIVLNWRSSRDTISSVRTLLNAYAKAVDVIVVDNNSGDDSLVQVKSELSELFDVVLEVAPDAKINRQDSRHSLVLVQNDRNAGYAGGNNLGIRIAIRAFEPQYVLILNSDARPTEGAVDKLVASMKLNEEVGFVAGVLVSGGEVQCVGGGNYIPWLGRSRLLGKGAPLADATMIGLDKLNYLMGACLLVRKALIESIGLMDEDYFLYCEEIDWQWRSVRAGWALRVCREAVIEHGDSASTKGKGQSELFFYYHNRAAILFNKKWYGAMRASLYWPGVILGACYQARSIRNVFGAVRGIVDGINGVVGRLSEKSH